MNSTALSSRSSLGRATWAVLATMAACLAGLGLACLSLVDAALVPGPWPGQTSQGTATTVPAWAALTCALALGAAAVALCSLTLNRLATARREVERAREAEAEARVARARIEAAIEASPEGLALFDGDGRLIRCGGDRALVEDSSTDGANPPESQERQLADGRWVRVDRRRTRHGDLVCLAIDITTTKQRESELAEKSRLLQATLEHMGEGLSVFDKSLRLIAWNDRFIEILQLPRHFAQVGAPLEAILTYQASRGHFGKVDVSAEVARRLASVTAPRPSVRQRRTPDGRTLELRRNPMPEGGFVTLYADITERTRSEEALRGSEERFKDFAEASSDWFWEMGPDLRFTHIGDRSGDITGVPRSSLVGLRREELPHAIFDPESLEKHVADMMARRPFRDFRYKARMSDGAIRYICSSGKPVYTADGIFLGYRGIGRDVTDAVEAEQRADLAQSRLVAAIEGLSEGIALFDKDDRLVVCNRAALRMNGLTADILVPGVSFETTLREDVRRGRFDLGEHEAEAFIQRRLAHHRNPTGPFERRLRSGRWEQVREQRLPEGGTVVLITDVTDVMEHYRLLGEKTDLLQTTLENMGEGISVHSGDLRLVTWNDRLLDLLNLRRDAVYPGLPLDGWLDGLIQRGETATPTFAAELRRRLADPSDVTAFEWPLASGRIIEVRFSAMPDGGLVTLYADATDRIRTEAMLREAKESAEMNNRAKSEFLAHMSHELRTPLNAVIGFSEMISRAVIGPIGNPKYSEYAHDIWEAGNHLLNIINDILDLAKVEAGKLELNEERLDLREVIEACLRVVRGRLQEKALASTIDVAADLPGLWADARSVKQILLNLMSNAVKFTPNGGRISIRASTNAEGAILLEVADSGIGMKPEDIPRALTPFVQVDSHLNRKFEGTGLGLPLCKTLIELHGGTLEIESEPEIGTTARVRFPASRTIDLDDVARVFPSEEPEPRLASTG